jgi:tryptophan-rich sensory protein
LHLILAALVEMALLWLLILITMILFWRRDRIAGLLFVPYLAWVSFAFALNFAIWQLNGA